MMDRTYQTKVDRLPYALSEQEKAEMMRVFAAVMKPLYLSAKPDFVQKLFQTDLLVRVFTDSGRLVGFGNMIKRTCGGHEVWHIYTAYIEPEYQGEGLMVRAIGRAIMQLAAENAFCVRRPLYVTGSTVNPITMLSLARRCSVWPDLLQESPAPAHVQAIADDATSRFYPMRGERPFQVRITRDYVELADFQDKKLVQVSNDSSFNRRFFEIVSLDELTMVFFVAEIRWSHLARHALHMLRAGLRDSLPHTADHARIQLVRLVSRR
jgi:hypothetical protein